MYDQENIWRQGTLLSVSVLSDKKLGLFGTNQVSDRQHKLYFTPSTSLIMNWLEAVIYMIKYIK